MTGRLADLSRTNARREADIHARLGDLNRQLVEADAARLALQAQLEHGEQERERIEGRDLERRAELERHIGVLEADRKAAWERVRELEGSLGRASARRAGIEDQLEQLRARLEGERRELHAQLDSVHAALKRSQQEAQQLRAHSSRLLEAMQQAQWLAETGGATVRELGQWLSDGSRLLQPAAGTVDSPKGGNLLSAVVACTAASSRRDSAARGLLVSRKFRLAAALPLLLGVLVSARAVWQGQATGLEASLQHEPRLSASAAMAIPEIRERRDPPIAGQATVPTTGSEKRVPPVAEEARMALAAMDAGRPASEAGAGFDAALQRQQQDLLALGFNLGESRADGLMGARTQRALEEFELLYLSVPGLQSISGNGQLAALIRTLAQRAREDAERLDISSAVLAAIQLSHMRTGVAFAYLAELAAVESRFNPATRSAGSTATGLYQFTEETWLQVLRTHGPKYGLEDDASSIAYVPGGGGRSDISDSARRQQVLDLRYNARVSALMAAEFANDNRRKLAAGLGREIDATDLYFAHFLGAADAIAFLSLRQIMPEGTAAKLFPEAARANGRVFYSPEGVPRTVAEVYSLFDRKFDTGHYQGWDPAVMLADMRE